MATNKEALEKLIRFVAELASQNGNAWFVDKLVRKITDLEAQPITRQILNEIHEHCIRNTARLQAQGFYNDFRIERIKPRLVDLYFEMELCRREDDFGGYCSALCKQIEAIVTNLFDGKVQDTIRDKAESPIGHYDSTKPLWQFIFYPKYLGLQQMIRKKDGAYPRWDYVYQFRSVLYYFFYEKDGKKFNSYEFKQFKESEESIRAVRDKNSHGDIVLNDYRQNLYDRAVSNRYSNYHKFSDFLDKFVSRINKVLP